MPYNMQTKEVREIWGNFIDGMLIHLSEEFSEVEQESIPG